MIHLLIFFFFFLSCFHNSKGYLVALKFDLAQCNVAHLALRERGGGEGGGGGMWS